MTYPLLPTSTAADEKARDAKCAEEPVECDGRRQRRLVGVIAAQVGIDPIHRGVVPLKKLSPFKRHILARF